MAKADAVWALGMMSGTSLDGVDAALVLTDGQQVFDFGPAHFRPYSQAEVAVLRGGLGKWPGDNSGDVRAVAEVIEAAHADVVAKFQNVDVVGFHGQTLAHAPQDHRTHQCGDGARLARETGLPVVWDFRSADLTAGGQGAPLAPFYHHALARQLGLKQPLAMVNLGGVGNVTWIDPCITKPEDDGALLAFDTGPANAPINDVMAARFGQAFDKDGAVARSGIVASEVLEQFFQNPYFEQKPPKSLDRDSFAEIPELIADLSDADAVASLTQLAVSSVYAAQMYFPADPSRWLICGGGRQNKTLMTALTNSMAAPVDPIEAVGFDGDMLEAQAFGFLAVRVMRGLPTSAPMTTGCAQPVCGGQISQP